MNWSCENFFRDFWDISTYKRVKWEFFMHCFYAHSKQKAQSTADRSKLFLCYSSWEVKTKFYEQNITVKIFIFKRNITEKIKPIGQNFFDKKFWWQRIGKSIWLKDEVKDGNEKNLPRKICHPRRRASAQAPGSPPARLGKAGPGRAQNPY